jgi:hypothetical protein
MNEQRRFTRIRVDAAAALTCGNTRHDVHVADLSLKGALLRFFTDTPVRVGDTCVLEVALDEPGATVRMQGDIRHTQVGRAGLHCSDIDIESIARLRRLVELKLGDRAALDRELQALWESGD